MLPSFSQAGRRLGIGLVVLTVAGLPLASSSIHSSFSLFGAPAQAQQRRELLVVSYAVTKAAYDKIFPLFAADWKKRTGETVTIKASYGGSGSQARAVIDGLEADVVHLALWPDVDRISKAGLIRQGWEKRLPNNSVPVNSTVALFARPGNPKKINSWRDLDNKDVDNVLANPKTSGGARWNYAVLWGAITESGGSEADARRFITGVYKNADVLPKDAREATDTFVKRRKGDVLLNWETEAILARRTGEWRTPYRLLAPNILTEQPIAVVDRNVDRKGNRRAAEALARFFYSPAAQRIFTDEGFRPVTTAGKAYARTNGKYQNVKFFTIGDLGGWAAFNKKHFDRGGVWDQIFSQTR